MTQHDKGEVPPTVSIGMPTYNCEKFIREAIDSLLRQTFIDFELIISDNASIDGTEAICREYAANDSRIRYIQQKENLGAVANFQFVLDEAIGEYFMWAASDDRCEPAFIERLLAVFKEDQDIVLAMSDVNNISESGSYLGVSKLENIRIDDVKKYWKRIRPLFFENPTSQIFFSIYGVFRTAVLRQISLDYFGLVRYASGSEIPLLAQVATKGKIVSIPDDLKDYRRHSNSVYFQEQRSSNLWMRLRNLCNISTCLIKIAIRSELPAVDKLRAMVAIFRTGSYKIFGFLLRRLLQALLCNQLKGLQTLSDDVPPRRPVVDR